MAAVRVVAVRVGTRSTVVMLVVMVNGCDVLASWEPFGLVGALRRSVLCSDALRGLDGEGWAHTSRPKRTPAGRVSSAGALGSTLCVARASGSHNTRAAIAPSAFSSSWRVASQPSALNTPRVASVSALLVPSAAPPLAAPPSAAPMRTPTTRPSRTIICCARAPTSTQPPPRSTVRTSASTSLGIPPTGREVPPSTSAAQHACPKKEASPSGRPRPPKRPHSSATSASSYTPQAAGVSRGREWRVTRLRAGLRRHASPAPRTHPSRRARRCAWRSGGASRRTRDEGSVTRAIAASAWQATTPLLQGTPRGTQPRSCRRRGGRR